ncbi:MAG: site-specific DNA-methyltransferase [Akkermansia sp.]|nr:site-specific DNA-methyltransferase [Akkermansia sp.]
MEFMKQLPDKCIDLVLTDPPYGKGNAEYDTSLRYGGWWDKYKNGKALSRTGGRYETGEKLVERTGGTWAEKYEKKISDWDVAPSDEVFAEIFRVSKHQIIWGGNYFNLPPTRCFNVWRLPYPHCKYCSAVVSRSRGRAFHEKIMYYALFFWGGIGEMKTQNYKKRSLFGAAFCVKR